MNQPLNRQILQICEEPIGAGQERVCYSHPDDETRLVKMHKGCVDKQTRAELALRARLAGYGRCDFERIPLSARPQNIGTACRRQETT